MIDINDLKGRKALTLLLEYDGINPYIKDLKNKYLKDGKLKLTETQIQYIIDIYNTPPQVLNKIVRINTYLGNSLKEMYDLPFVPERILIQAMLADQEKTYHVYGKLTQKQKNSKCYWLPKTMVLDDPYFTECEIDVDWEKYAQMDIIGRTPYTHQKEGIKFLLCRDNAILGDHMGLGKTYQSIISSLEKGYKKILIICPSSMKISWQREIENFNKVATIVNGSKWPYVGQFTIINYEILKNFHTVGPQTKDENGELNPHYRNLVNEKYDLLILDEAHKVKDPKTQRGSIINDLVLTHGINSVWLLTGTPIANRPMDFYNLLRLIRSPLADNWHFFAKRYCDGKRFNKTLKNGKKKQIWVTSGASNLEELNIRTKDLLLRRLKSEVLDMPDKTIITNYHTLSKRGEKEYEMLWDEYVEKRALDGKRKISSLSRDLVELGLLRKFIAMETIPHTIELINDAIEEGQKVIVFTTFTEELEEIASHFGKECVIHNGSMSTTLKQKSVDAFQNDNKVKIFVGNITSAGVGITLTEASVVIFNSFSWVPGDNEQAEDRAHRIGQKNNVSVYYQLFLGTVSLMMWYKLVNKQKIIDQIIAKNDEHGKRLRMLIEDMEKNGFEL